MVNPLLTVLFDLFLVGSAITIIAALVQEYFDSRTPSIGGHQADPARRRSASVQGQRYDVRGKRGMKRAA